jgi:hypothetical protein
MFWIDYWAVKIYIRYIVTEIKSTTPQKLPSEAKPHKPLLGHGQVVTQQFNSDDEEDLQKFVEKYHTEVLTSDSDDENTDDNLEDFMMTTKLKLKEK